MAELSAKKQLDLARKARTAARNARNGITGKQSTTKAESTTKKGKQEVSKSLKQLDKSSRIAKDFYDVNSDSGSRYIHSSHMGFNNIYEQSVDNGVFDQINDKVFSKLKAIIENMVDREILFYEKLEEKYVNEVNKESGIKYENIDDLYENFKEVYKKKGEKTVLAPLVALIGGLEEYRKLSRVIDKQTESKFKKEGVKFKSSSAEMNKARNELAKARSEREQDIVWFQKFLQSVNDVYEFTKKGLLTIDDPSSTKINIDREKTPGLYKLRENFKSSIAYAEKKKYKLSQAGQLKGIMSTLNDSNASYFDFLESLSLHSPRKDFIDIAKALQTSSKLGLAYEEIFPEIMADKALKKFMTIDKVKEVGASWSLDNITDAIIGEVVEGGETIPIGVSLKLKAEDQTRNTYQLPDIWTGKIEGFKTEGEKELLKEAEQYKNMISWVKNNYIATSAWVSDETDTSSSVVQQGIEDIKRLEEELGSWILLPRFFNGFLREVELGKFSAYNTKKMHDVAYTVFIISGDDVYLTSKIMKNIKKTMLSGAGSPVKDSNTNKMLNISSSRTETKSEKDLSSLKNLYEEKKNSWKNMEKITYMAMASDQKVSTELSQLNTNMSLKSLVKEIVFAINFNKANL